MTTAEPSLSPKATSCSACARVNEVTSTTTSVPGATTSVSEPASSRARTDHRIPGVSTGSGNGPALVAVTSQPSSTNRRLMARPH